jgi:hypothetical protein
MEFQEYLIQLGYTKKVYNFSNLVDANVNETLSTTGHSVFFYTKDNEKNIAWGIIEFDKQPTLIGPRPIFIINDNEMYEYIANHTNDELYNLIK